MGNQAKSAFVSSLLLLQMMHQNWKDCWHSSRKNYWRHLAKKPITESLNEISKCLWRAIYGKNGVRNDLRRDGWLAERPRGLLAALLLPCRFLHHLKPAHSWLEICMVLFVSFSCLLYSLCSVCDISVSDTEETNWSSQRCLPHHPWHSPWGMLTLPMQQSTELFTISSKFGNSYGLGEYHAACLDRPSGRFGVIPCQAMRLFNLTECWHSASVPPWSPPLIWLFW